MPDLFTSNGNTLSVNVESEYDPGITEEIDRQIRHMPNVILHCTQKAAELRAATGSSNFEIVSQTKPETQRPRIYVVPKNDAGIREELAESVLLKAALGMAGK